MKSKRLAAALAALLLAGLCACRQADNREGSASAAAASSAPGPAGTAIPETAARTEAETIEQTGADTEAPARTGAGAESSAVPEATAYVPRSFTEADYNIYLTGSGAPDPDRISVEFMPGNTRNGHPDPNIRIWNSSDIWNEEEITAICTRILEDPLYDVERYGRTLESMVTEWRAHSDIDAIYPNERTRHVDLDRDDEDVSYAEFWQRALRAFNG